MRYGMFIRTDAFGTEINQWLKAFNHEAHDGRGTVEMTPDPAQAMTFDNAMAVLECWRSVSETRPFRPDGKPNRPLTAFSVEPRPLETID